MGEMGMQSVLSSDMKVVPRTEVGGRGPESFRKELLLF